MYLNCVTVILSVVQGIHSVLEFSCVGGNPDIVKLILEHVPLRDGEYVDEVCQAMSLTLY